MRIHRLFCLVAFPLCATFLSCGGDAPSAHVVARAPTKPPVSLHLPARTQQPLNPEFSRMQTIQDRAAQGRVLAFLARAVEYAETARRARVLAAKSESSDAPPAISAPISLQPCGGDLPPCSVAQRESGGSYTAYNPRGCGGAGCYGKWQFSGAWAGKLGLPADLATATPEQQDNAARSLWDHGRGCSNWGACN